MLVRLAQGKVRLCLLAVLFCWLFCLLGFFVVSKTLVKLAQGKGAPGKHNNTQKQQQQQQEQKQVKQVSP